MIIPLYFEHNCYLFFILLHAPVCIKFYTNNVETFDFNQNKIKLDFY